MTANNDGAAAQQGGRFVLVTGGKGGVGKSTFSRGLLDVYLSQGITVAAYDGDPDNSQLFRFYQQQGAGVVPLALDVQGQADRLLDEMEAAKAQVFLIDVAAGGSKTLRDLEDDIGLVSEAVEMGYGFTVVSVMSRVKDSVNLLRNTLEMTEGLPADHVAVKNLYFGDEDQFELFDESKTKPRLTERGGVVVEMPKLFDDTYAAIDQANLPFRTALGVPTRMMPRAHKSRVRKWLRLFEAELRGKAQGVLGL